MAGENKVRCHTLTVCPGSSAYVHHVTTGRTAGHDTVHLL